MAMKIAHVFDSDYERFLKLFQEAYQADKQAPSVHLSSVSYPGSSSELEGATPLPTELPNSELRFELPTEPSAAELSADPFHTVPPSSIVTQPISPDDPWGSFPGDFSRR